MLPLVQIFMYILAWELQQYSTMLQYPWLLPLLLLLKHILTAEHKCNRSPGMKRSVRWQKPEGLKKGIQSVQSMFLTLGITRSHITHRIQKKTALTSSVQIRNSPLTSLVRRQDRVLRRPIVLVAAVALLRLCFMHPWIFVHRRPILTGSEVHGAVHDSTCFLPETAFVLS